MSRHDGHDAFLEALYDPQTHVPPGLNHPQGGAAEARFAVYRNNVVYGLMQNLRDGFPLLHALLGDAAFDALAAAFARAHPPTDPLMFAYGAALPAFMTDHAELADVPYAVDVARLELAMREASHAAEHQPVPPEKLAAATSAAMRLTLAPCLSVIASDWPLHDLYLFLNEVIADAPDMSRAQHLMIYRQQAGGVVLEPLSSRAASFLTALQTGQSIANAAQGVDEKCLSDTLQRLVLAALITDMQ